jgi:hypothetical protein
MNRSMRQVLGASLLPARDDHLEQFEDLGSEQCAASGPLRQGIEEFTRSCAITGNTAASQRTWEPPDASLPVELEPGPESHPRLPRPRQECGQRNQPAIVRHLSTQGGALFG